jgi:hypothetical protein
MRPLQLGPRVHALLAAVPLLAASALPAQSAQDDTGYAVRCGAALPGESRSRYLALPRGDLFCPMLADPKSMRSFVSYQRGNARDFAEQIAAVGVADQVGFFRVSDRDGNGLQLGVSGAVFAQFDVAAPSIDLLNADYLIAIPLTMRRGALSGRLRVYHQSSHLGDELLLRPNAPTRENLSFEAVDGIASVDIGALRFYGGGEYYFGRDPATLPAYLVHGGAELRLRASARLGTIAIVRPVAGADVKGVSDSTWNVGVNARAGFEFSRPREGDVPGRRWSLLADYYDGPSPFGQFRTSNVRLTGIGLHFPL